MLKSEAALICKKAKGGPLLNLRRVKLSAFSLETQTEEADRLEQAIDKTKVGTEENKNAIKVWVEALGALNDKTREQRDLWKEIIELLPNAGKEYSTFMDWAVSGAFNEEQMKELQRQLNKDILTSQSQLVSAWGENGPTLTAQAGRHTAWLAGIPERQDLGVYEQVRSGQTGEVYWSPKWDTLSQMLQSDLGSIKQLPSKMGNLRWTIQPGEFCARCDSGRLRQTRGIGIGSLAQLGPSASAKSPLSYQGKAGAPRPVFMGSYRLNLSRLAAAVAEQHHDEAGIRWPAALAPFQVHLIGLNLEEEAIRNEAEKVYRHLLEEKFDVLFDDRDVRAGENFSDSDLLGLPLRLTLSKRTSKEGKLELKLRTSSQSEWVTPNEALMIVRTSFPAKLIKP